MLSRGYIVERELTLFKILDSPKAAVDEIVRFYRSYHSYRFVKRDLIIRLNHPPAPALIETLNRDFTDIITEGTVRATEALPEEADDPNTLHLPRIMMRFNRADFPRLRQMIDVIDAAEINSAPCGRCPFLPTS